MRAICDGKTPTPTYSHISPVAQPYLPNPQNTYQLLDIPFDNLRLVLVAPAPLVAVALRALKVLAPRCIEERDGRAEQLRLLVLGRRVRVREVLEEVPRDGRVRRQLVVVHHL